MVAVILAPTSVHAETVNETKTEYIVVSGDYLDKIATSYGTTWQRLFDKNPQIEHQDKIFTGDKIVIPAKDEVVQPRTAVVAPVVVPEAVIEQPAPKEAPKPAYVAPRVFTGTNLYTAGQCTWHVKNLKPNLPNNLGNASEWYGSARDLGLAVGTEPSAGAAAPRKYGNHVVYVQAVNGDGTITVSEMNYNWIPFESRTSVKPASDYYYIY